jgi:hypothetical protein
VPFSRKSLLKEDKCVQTNILAYLSLEEGKRCLQMVRPRLLLSINSPSMKHTGILLEKKMNAEILGVTLISNLCYDFKVCVMEFILSLP